MWYTLTSIQKDMMTLCIHVNVNQMMLDDTYIERHHAVILYTYKRASCEIHFNRCSFTCTQKDSMMSFCIDSFCIDTNEHHVIYIQSVCFHSHALYIHLSIHKCIYICMHFHAYACIHIQKTCTRVYVHVTPVAVPQSFASAPASRAARPAAHESPDLYALLGAVIQPSCVLIPSTPALTARPPASVAPPRR